MSNKLEQKFYPLNKSIRRPTNANLTIINNNLEFGVTIHKKIEIQKFPHMPKTKPFRKVPDENLPVEKKSKYWILKHPKTPEEQQEQFDQEHVGKALRYGRTLLRLKENRYVSKIDGIETFLGEENAMEKYEREFTIQSFVKKNLIPIVFFQSDSWNVLPQEGNEEIYKALHDTMALKNVVGIGRFVLTKSYVVRNVIIYPTEKEGLILQVIPWGNTFVADGLSAELKCSVDQVEWMKKYISELPGNDKMEYERNPLLTRFWTNIQNKLNDKPLDLTLPVDKRPQFSDDLKDDAEDLFDWNEQIQF